MPRKTEKPAVQKGGTVVASPDAAVTEQETPPRRSARTAARGDSSSAANRSRRSSTAAQTAASVAESRVTRSGRSNSNRRRSSSPQENVRTRSSRETSAESPASRVKATRRSTSRINYQESEGEEDTSATTERNEEEYLVEDDAEESDSEESNRSRNKTRTASKSPPKVRGRGRGRATKVVGRGRGKISQFEEPSDKENDKISGTDTTDNMAAPRTRRQQKEVEPVETGRRTRGSSGQKEQIEVTPARGSRRSEKKVKVDVEGESVPLSKPKPARSTRGRQSYTEETESPAHEETASEQKEVELVPDQEQEEEKRKRKLKTIDEPHKRQKLEKSTIDTELDTEAKSEESCTKRELMEENSNLEKPLETEATKEEPDEDVSSKSVNAPNPEMEMVPEKTISSESVTITKEETTISSEQCKEIVEEDEPMEIQTVDDLSVSKLSEDKNPTPAIQEEKMECGDDDVSEEEDCGDDNRNIFGDEQSTQEMEDIAEKIDAYSRVSNENSETKKNEQKQEIDLSSNKSSEEEEEEEKEEHILTDEVQSVIKEHKETLASPATTVSVTPLSVERTTDEHITPTNLTSEIVNVGDSNACEKEHDTQKEQKSEVYSPPRWEKELSTSLSLPSSESSFQCPSAEIAELSSSQEADPNTLDINEKASVRENNIAHSAHLPVSESNRSVVESNNAVGIGATDALSVNGADLCVGESAENALDMSKGSDDSVSESERVSSDLSLHPATTTTVLECATTKANGTHHSISATSTEPPPFALTNRRYIVNPSLSEDTRSRLKCTTFSLISFNMGAMRNESAYTEKLGLEIRRTEADIICLQEIKMTFYSESLEHVMNNFGYKGLLSIPENRSRGLGIFYNTKTFNLIRQAGIPLQKVIDQDLETSSLENNDKAAVRDFLEKCGHMLVAQLKSVIADRTLTIANVMFPPCDIGTHALQMSSSVREVVSFLDDIARPHVICGSFNMTEGGVAYQLLREGYLNNEMIEELQQRKDVRLPGKENDTLVNLLWKAFQHPSSNLRSCYAAAMGHELHLGNEKSVTSPDLLWYSSDSLETLGVLDVGPAVENLDHVALKADIAYAC